MSDQKKIPEVPAKLKPVVKATVKPKSGASKFFSSFIADDVPDIRRHVLMDVFVPAIKQIISDTVSMILYKTPASNRSKHGTNASRVSYRNYYDEPSRSRPSTTQRRSSHYSHDDIIFDTLRDAEEVLAAMEDAIDRYGAVTINDLYDLIGHTRNHADQKYGWTNLSKASVQRIPEGYTIKLPRAEPLN